MAWTTPTNTNVASLNSYLPPAWESTFLFYLVLPGLCAFFLFLFIFCVAFKLIKTRKHGSTRDHRYNTRSYIEQSSDTCIYEVINENLGTPVIPSGLHGDYNKPYSHNLQVCLPALHDHEDAKDDIATKAQSSLELPYSLPLSKGQGQGGQYYDVSRLMGLLEEEAFPVVEGGDDNIQPCGMPDSRPATRLVSSQFMTYSQHLLKSHNIDEYPIYESLDKSWRKNSLDSNVKIHSKMNNSNDSGCCGSRSKDLDKCEDTAVADCLQSEQFVRKSSLTTNSKDLLAKVIATNNESVFSNAKTTPQFDEKQRNAHSSDYNVESDHIEGGIQAQAGQAICKLSIVVGGGDYSGSPCKPTVRHYYYRIKNENITGLGQDDCNNWADKLSMSHVLLTPDKLYPENVDTANVKNPSLEQNTHLKLELMNAALSLSDLTALSKGSKYSKKSANLPDSKSTHVPDYRRSDSCENMSEKTPSNYNQRKRGALKKSQSFKESGKYKKSGGGRGRKFSLGALSSGAQNKIYKEVEQHHRSFDRLEVERTLSRLGPLPPTPTPPQTPPPLLQTPPPMPPSSPPPPLSSSTTPPMTPFLHPAPQQHPEDKPHLFEFETSHKNSSKPHDTQLNNNATNTQIKDTTIINTINSNSVLESLQLQGDNASDTKSDAANSGEIKEDTKSGNSDIAETSSWKAEEGEKETNGNKNSHYFILENGGHCCVSDDSESEPDEDKENCHVNENKTITTEDDKDSLYHVPQDSVF